MPLTLYADLIRTSFRGTGYSDVREGSYKICPEDIESIPGASGAIEEDMGAGAAPPYGGG